MINNIGWIQGRLSPIVDGKIQAFPWGNWENEFSAGQSLSLSVVEWTLDRKSIYDNPIMSPKFVKKIADLKTLHSVSIPSLTADFYMQKPHWKESTLENNSFEIQVLKDVISACSVHGIKIIVIPLVDNASIDKYEDEKKVKETFLSLCGHLRQCDVAFAFESDYPPDKLINFISYFPVEHFGINYDIGNSASLGYDPSLELNLYGHRVINVHVKDRLYMGGTVPLGEGDANFGEVFNQLKILEYTGNYMLQTARDSANDHIAAIAKYKKFVEQCINAKKQ